MKASFLAVALSALMVNVMGCGGTTDTPELGQVSGTVTLDGAAVKGIQVTFVPDSGRPSTGRTDAEGKYKLKYIRETEGAKIGHHRVEIGAGEGEEEEDEGSGTEGEAAPQKAKPKSAKPQIPAKYNTQSILEAEVKPGENVLDYKLESK